MRKTRIKCMILKSRQKRENKGGSKNVEMVIITLVYETEFENKGSCLQTPDT